MQLMKTPGIDEMFTYAIFWQVIGVYFHWLHFKAIPERISEDIWRPFICMIRILTEP